MADINQWIHFLGLTGLLHHLRGNGNHREVNTIIRSIEATLLGCEGTLFSAQLASKLAFDFFNDQPSRSSRLETPEAYWKSPEVVFGFPAFLNGPLRRTSILCYQEQTPVWSESSVDEHNLYFARSAIIGYLAVETWRVKTELIIITILHIIIITTSILNLGFKTFAPKISAHTTCINRYWKYTQIFAAKIKANLLQKTGKTYCENKTGQNLLQKSLNIGACLK